MKFSEHWLRTFVDPPLDTRGLADALDDGRSRGRGRSSRPRRAFDGVVVGEVLSVEPHPDADRLSRLPGGRRAARRCTIVCGAPNVRAGMKVAAALIGAQLPGLAIEAAHVRGVESHGMLCSAQGARPDRRRRRPAGARRPMRRSARDVRDVLALDDPLLTLKLTPNRADCLSILGIAREVAAVTGAALECAAIGARRRRRSPTTLPVALDAPDACPRYCGRLVRGVNARRATPAWMVHAPRAQRHPLDQRDRRHHQLRDARARPAAARVRRRASSTAASSCASRARARSSTLLNGADAAARARLPRHRRRGEGRGARRHHGRRADRGRATRRATSSSKARSSRPRRSPASRARSASAPTRRTASSAASISRRRSARSSARRSSSRDLRRRAGPADRRARRRCPQREPVRLRLARAERLLGITLDAERAGDILRRLGFAVRGGASATSRVTPPSYRFDIAIEEDFVEEVARIHGYDKIPAAAPLAHASDAAAPGSAARAGRAARAARGPRLAGSRHLQLRRPALGSTISAATRRRSRSRIRSQAR